MDNEHCAARLSRLPKMIGFPTHQKTWERQQKQTSNNPNALKTSLAQARTNGNKPPHPQVGYLILMPWPRGPPWPGPAKSSKHPHATPISHQGAWDQNITDAPMQERPQPTSCSNLPITIILGGPVKKYYTLQTFVHDSSKDTTMSFFFKTQPQKHIQNILETYSRKSPSQKDTQRELFHATYDQKILHERRNTRGDDAG